MKPESLHALIVDRHFGELSPEAAELLELHLARDAAARAEAQRVVQSLAVTRDAVLRHPELAPAGPLETGAASGASRFKILPMLVRAAAVLLLAALAGAGGFLAGRSESKTVVKAVPPAAVREQAVPRKESPWARYRMSFDPAGEGMQVVRVDTAGLERKAAP